MRYLILLLLLFTAGNLRAQAYHPFPTANASWSETSEDYYSYYKATEDYLNGYHFSLEGDTVIKSVHYTLVGLRNTWQAYSLIGWPFDTIDNDRDNIKDTMRIVGAIREDSAKKVWFRNLNDSNWSTAFLSLYQLPIDTDILLYDFNLKLKDSITVRGYYTGDTVKFVVMNIDSIRLNDGVFRKQFTIKRYLTTNYWIEGVGSASGLFSGYNYTHSDGEHSSWINCFIENGQTLIESLEPSVLLTCDSIALIAPKIAPKRTVHTYPNLMANPVTDKMLVNSNQLTGAEIDITDVLGRTLISQSINTRTDITTIDVRGLATGIYLLTATGNQRNRIVVKFVKE